MMTEQKKYTFWFTVRHFLYCAGCFGMTFLEQAVAAICKEKTFDENGIIENLQLSELLLACTLFLVLAFRNRAFRKLGIVFASLCAFATCRELDNILDDHLPFFGWKIAFLFIVVASGYAIRHWKMTMEELLRFLRHPSFIMMCCAITVVISVAQCIGHRSFVMNVLQVEHVGNIKEFIEESIETVGYFILLCSVIELFFNPLQHIPQTDAD